MLLASLILQRGGTSWWMGPVEQRKPTHDSGTWEPGKKTSWRFELLRSSARQPFTEHHSPSWRGSLSSARNNNLKYGGVVLTYFSCLEVDWMHLLPELGAVLFLRHLLLLFAFVCSKKSIYCIWPILRFLSIVYLAKVNNISQFYHHEIFKYNNCPIAGVGGSELLLKCLCDSIISETNYFLRSRFRSRYGGYQWSSHCRTASSASSKPAKAKTNTRGRLELRISVFIYTGFFISEFKNWNSHRICYSFSFGNHRNVWN